MQIPLYGQTQKIKQFLQDRGFELSEISVSLPVINDKRAQNYGNYNANDIRYTASQTITVYTNKIQQVIEAQGQLIELGKKGIVLGGNGYGPQTQYLFSGLNNIKPEMIEDATQKARKVATKFAQDSDSKLGKIKLARQGQFTIEDRDSNTPHIKRVRVVSTIEYYLVD